jgi:hypothetical protein
MRLILAEMRLSVFADISGEPDFTWQRRARAAFYSLCHAR